MLLFLCFLSIPIPTPPQVWSSPGGTMARPAGCALRSRWCPHARVVFCSAHHAEASQGSWWNPTGKSRRQARSLRYSLLVQTGKEVLTPCAGRAGCPQAGKL
uniref:Secreted protein n=1 Tax=Amazona collaria TaxID=241587 RepID=A0A8B9F598_9PSIT